eukprot:RCo027211
MSGSSEPSSAATSSSPLARAPTWGVWDQKTQTFHAGQEWKFIPNYVEDFSVTTNALGTPESGLAAASEVVDSIGRYPPSDFQPALEHLAQFLWPDEWRTNGKRLLLGNGASELIDLIARSATMGGWKPGPNVVQYKEYERSAVSCGFKTLAADDPSATLLCMINPCNPTGEYLPLEQIKAYIERHASTGCTVMVDESMQPWLGPHWRTESLTSQSEWVSDMATRKNVKVYVIHSWTKLWSCAGIRLGSVVAPTYQDYLKVKSAQIPWSVNCFALAFLQAVTHDEPYLRQTWEVTTPWRELSRKAIEKDFGWKVYGEPWLSWLWVDTFSEATANEAVRLAKAAGTPVRTGKAGYEMGTFVRFAVRSPEKQAVLLASW